MLTSLAALLAAAVVGVPLLAFLAQDRLLFFPQPLAEARRQEILRRFPAVREVFLQAQDKRIHAWHVPAAPGRPLVLYFGGNAEDVSWMIADAQARLPGFGWLLTSYRGYGRSEGEPSERALSADALRWYDFAANELGAKSIFVFGRSLGSGPAVHVASRRAVAGALLVTPFDSLVAVGKRHYPLLPVGWLLKHRFESVELAPRIEAPLLCVAAGRDEVIPLVHSKRLFDAWAGPKRWVELREAGHNNTDGDPQFWGAIRSFVEKKNDQPA